MMQFQRLMCEFSDGNRETRQPAASPTLGDKLTRRARVWTVSEVHDRGDVFIVTLQRADRQDKAA
jgi:hypothetical protein